MVQDNGSLKSIARSQIYKLLSICFTYPDAKLQEILSDEKTPQLLKNLVEYRESSNLEPAGTSSDLVEELARSIRESPSSLELEHEYVRLFSQGENTLCMPYEAEYGAAHVFAVSRELADIAGFYHAFGLKSSDTAKERPDHASVELEFMHILSLKEAYAREKRYSDKLSITVEAERKFLQEHLGKWLPALCRSLQDGSQHQFYITLGKLAEQFLRLEADYLHVELGSARYSKSPPPPSFTCGGIEAEGRA